MAKHGTSVWVAVAVTWALVIAVGGWRLGSGVVDAALDAGARLSRVSQVSAGQILADDSNDLGKLYQADRYSGFGLSDSIGTVW